MSITECKRESINYYYLIIIPLLFLPCIFFEFATQVYYITPCSLISFYLILYNYPYFLKSIHTKPLYFEDLEDNDAIDSEVKRKFQKTFLIIINFILPFIASAIVDYMVYRFRDSSLSWFEVLGFVGGMISLYRSIWDHVGRFLLMYLMDKKQKVIFKRKESRRIVSFENNSIIEMGSLESIDSNSQYFFDAESDV